MIGRQIVILVMLFTTFAVGQLTQGGPIINLTSAFIYIYFFWLIYNYKHAQFMRFIFVHLTLAMGVIGSLMLDFNQGAFLYEINKYVVNASTTPMVAFYTALIQTVLTLDARRLDVSGKAIYDEGDFRVTCAVLDFMALANLGLVMYILSQYGVPILLGVERIYFYNSLPDDLRQAYVLLNIFTFYAGFRYFKTKRIFYFSIFVAVLVLRLLSSQKFTEILICFSLFYSFRLFGGAGELRFFRVGVAIFIIGLLPLVVATYDGSTQKLVNRLTAQAQLSYVVNDLGAAIAPKVSELPVEFMNFSGDNEVRLKLFSEGQYYGVYKLMKVANTGRDLYAQAEQFTSASGTVPAIFIYYFGLIFSIPVLVLVTWFLKGLADFLCQTAIETNNVLIVVVGSLIMIRIYKFFVIGSPSYLFNDQFLKYGVVLILLLYFPLKLSSAQSLRAVK